MSTHDALRHALGSYLLGALEPRERAEVEQHLTSCAVCREELAAHAGLPGLLKQVSLEEATTEVSPPPSVLSGLLRAVEDSRRQAARRLRRWQTAAATLLAATAVAAAAALALSGPPVGSGASFQPLASAAGASTAGRVALDSRPWGTSVHLRVQGLPAATYYRASVVGADGTTYPVATWGQAPHGDADVIGAAPLPIDAIRRLVVSTASDQQLLVLAR